MIYNRKYNNGGLISYQYGDVGGPTGSPSSAGSDKAAREEKDVFGDALWKSIADGGLTSDTQILAMHLQSIQKSTRFAFTDEDKRNQMLSLLPRVVEMKNNQKLWENAYQTSKESGGLSEIAVGEQGDIYVQNENGNVISIPIETFKKSRGKYQALSVAELLNRRESDPNLANKNIIFDVANNSISMSTIHSHISKVVSALGKEINSEEYIFDKYGTEEDWNNIKQGIQSGREPTEEEWKGLATLQKVKNSPARYYEIMESSSTERNHIEKAVEYIWGTLGSSARNKLQASAAVDGINPIELISKMIIIGTDQELKTTIKPVSEAVAKTGSSSASMPAGKAQNNPQMMTHGTLQTNEMFEFNDPDYGTMFSGTLAGQSKLTDVKGNAIPPASFEEVLGVGGWGEILKGEEVYFAGELTPKLLLNEIIVDGVSDMAKVFLPVDRNGRPDYNSLQLFKEVMEDYNNIKEDPNVNKEDIRKRFADSGFNVQVNDDLSVVVTAQGSNVKPFFFTMGYTNSGSQLSKNKRPSSQGGMTEISGGEKDRVKKRAESVWVEKRDGKYRKTGPKGFLWTNYYKAPILVPYREGAEVRHDAAVDRGPIKSSYSTEQVMSHAQRSSGNTFNNTNIQVLND